MCLKNKTELYYIVKSSWQNHQLVEGDLLDSSRSRNEPVIHILSIQETPPIYLFLE
jgi:hypothetical protein